VTTAASVTLIAVICFVASPMPVAMGSSTPNVWSVATEPSPTGNWYAVNYGGGQWVALGHSPGGRGLARRLNVDGISRADRFLAVGCVREWALRGTFINERESRGDCVNQCAELDVKLRADRSMDGSYLRRRTILLR